jgi:DNA-binding transcriptional LysR family regulator
MRLTTVTLTEAILGLAEAGEAVAILARSAAEEAARTGRVRMLRVGQQGLRRRWQLVTLATGVSALHVQCFASAVQQVAVESTGTPREPTTTKPRVTKTA